VSARNVETTPPAATSRSGEGAPDEPRRINVLLLASSLWIGGAETVMRHLAMAIDRRRFNVTVCHLKQRGHIGEALARDGVEVVGISDDEQPKVDYFTSLKLLKLIRARNIDVVHTHTTHGLVDASICRMLRPSLRVVHTFHFGNYPHTRPRIIWMERIFSRMADRLIAVGEVQRGQLRSVFGFRPDQITTIWNGVRLPGAPIDDGFRRRIGASDGILVGTIATLIDQKGLPDLLRVARRIRDRYDHVKFVIVGEGVLRAELEAERRALGLDDAVILTGWVTSAAEVALPAFDIFFQPSLWEAMSVVTLEAMAAGKPLVVTRVGEAPHIVEDGVDGLLAPPTDVEAMTSALTRLIDDPDLRQRMGRNARQKIESQFTVDHMTRAYEQAYLDVLR
jgi:glycosyltransferase involved in cell wall biosynthesis